MKEKMVAVSILLSLMLVPLSALGTEKTKKSHSAKGTAASAVSTPSASPTPQWDITRPSSCSVEGPPPCEKCAITCPAGHPPVCVPGDVANNACVKPNSCICKEERKKLEPKPEPSKAAQSKPEQPKPQHPPQ